MAQKHLYFWVKTFDPKDPDADPGPVLDTTVIYYQVPLGEVMGANAAGVLDVGVSDRMVNVSPGGLECALFRVRKPLPDDDAKAVATCREMLKDASWTFAKGAKTLTLHRITLAPDENLAAIFHAARK